MTIKDLQLTELRKAYDALTSKVCGFELWMSNYCFEMLESDFSIDNIRVLDNEDVAYTFKLRNKQIPFKVV